MNPYFKHLSLCALLGLLLFFASPAFGQISLGTAQSFGALGGSTITNTGDSAVIGNVGVSPGTAVTGFPPGTLTGTKHLGDAVAAQAQSDATTAYNAILDTACGTDLTGQNLGGLTLTPGVYCFSTSAQLTGILTLNALGNSNALFIFKIGSSLTTASGAVVQVINPGTDCNIFWQVGSSATLGTGTAFVGNILALASITATTGSSVSGSLIARNGAVTLDTNAVAICAPAATCPVITLNPGTLPNGILGAPYSQTVSGVGGTAPYTFTVSSGALPSGLTLNATTGMISGTPSAAATFTFTITATDTNSCPGSQAYSIVIVGSPNCPIITLTPGTLPPGLVGTPYSQTISAVGGMAPYTFAVSSGALPPGLTLNTANGGSVILSGTPAMSGLFTFTITATDSNGCPGGEPYSIVVPVVTICPAITVNPATLASGVVLAGYGQEVTAVGGTAPYTFAVSSGALPPGLALSAGDTTTNAVISGVPTLIGTFTFTITATDANGCPGSRTYSVVIGAGAGGGGSPPGGGTVPTLSEWGAILMALLIIAACTFFLAGPGRVAMSLASAEASAAFTGDGNRAQKPIDWKLLARTALCVEAVTALALIALSAKPVDVLGALTSGLVVAFILHLLIAGARRR
jgi:hypothetical protein